MLVIVNLHMHYWCERTAPQAKIVGQLQRHSQGLPWHTETRTGVHDLETCMTWKLDLETCMCAHTVNKPCAPLRNALLCARSCTPWTLHALGWLSAQEVHKFVWLKFDYERTCTSWALKCTRTWSMHVVQNLVHKSAFPGSAQSLLPVSAQGSF